VIARSRADARSLTGIWNGLYTYPDGRSTSFVATLIEASGTLCGTTHEPSTLPSSPGVTLIANLTGSRRGSCVTFTKTYDAPDLMHRSPILYEGVLNADATEIEGRWTIVSVWSGKFLMIRSAGEEVKAERKALERV
jgi:hypothetical protein